MISERSFARSFASAWEGFFPLLTPRFVGLFNEAYEKVLKDSDGVLLVAAALPAEIRPDVVAEFGFWGAEYLHATAANVDVLLSDEAAIKYVSQKALAVVEKYEGKKPTLMMPLTKAEMHAGALLAVRYESLYRAFSSGTKVEFRPKFSGCGFLNAAEGDLAIGDTLVEVKSTTRSVAGKDLRQLVTYLALDACAGIHRWSNVAIFNPRRGTLHLAEVAPLLLRLSGGKPRVDVLADVVDFLQTDDSMTSRSF